MLKALQFLVFKSVSIDIKALKILTPLLCWEKGVLLLIVKYIKNPTLYLNSSILLISSKNSAPCIFLLEGDCVNSSSQYWKLWDQ